MNTKQKCKMCSAEIELSQDKDIPICPEQTGRNCWDMYINGLAEQEGEENAE